MIFVTVSWYDSYAALWFRLTWRANTEGETFSTYSSTPTGTQYRITLTLLIATNGCHTFALVAECTHRPPSLGNGTESAIVKELLNASWNTFPAASHFTAINVRHRRRRVWVHSIQNNEVMPYDGDRVMYHWNTLRRVIYRGFIVQILTDITVYIDLCEHAFGLIKLCITRSHNIVSNGSYNTRCLPTQWMIKPIARMDLPRTSITNDTHD